MPYVESLFLPEFKINSDFQSNKYELLNTISQGAFGKVYKVKDIETDELLALKVLSKSQVIYVNVFKYSLHSFLWFIEVASDNNDLLLYLECENIYYRCLIWVMTFS